MKFFLLMAALSCSLGAARADLLDRSHEIFVPAKIQKQISVQKKFPMFWWNFVVLDPTEKGPDWPDWEGAHRICERLKTQIPVALNAVECEQDLRDFEPFIRDWSRDLVLREPRPSDGRIVEALQRAMAQAALPTGDSGLLNILRQDPLESWRKLKELAEGRLSIAFERKNGFFFDGATGRIAIPLQAKFPPMETERTRQLQGLLEGSWTMIGGHGSTVKNEEQVTKDANHVSLVGAAIVIACGAFLVAARRWRLLLLFPPVFFSTLCAAGLTILIFGSIHGLTLSFGSAIIGLAMDFGIYGSLNARSKTVWRTNLMGLATTLVGLIVLSLSSIPLLRQMMVFGIVGLMIAFLILYFLVRRYASVFEIRPFPIVPKSSRFKVILSGLLIIASLAGLFFLRPKFEMARFDYQDPHTREVTNWFFRHWKSRPPLFAVHSGAEALTRAHEERKQAELHAIPIENLANYLPSESEQRANAQTWGARFGEHCTDFLRKASPESVKLFEPFLQTQLCRVGGAEAVSRRYLDHLNHQDEWITLWLPKEESQEQWVKSTYPEATSLRDVVSSFPTILEHELHWMAPLSFLIAISVLFLYFRNWLFAFTSVLPFFTGLGTVAVSIWVFGYSFSFVSLVACLIVFGFSLDYGIFATEICRRTEEQPERVWTAVAFSAFTTGVGFVPLMLCKHPVLSHLGQTLFFGALGTYLGAIWGVPALAGLGRGRK